MYSWDLFYPLYLWPTLTTSSKNHDLEISDWHKDYEDDKDYGDHKDYEDN